MNIMTGDCLDKLRELADSSIDSLVTDPPAGIAFMGKDWDKDRGGRAAWVAWMTEVMRECLRVLKPGAHGLVWALPRTSHWTATALEDAGFEIRDVVTHLFGTGFPKSLDVSKAIDKAAGAEREVIGKSMGGTPSGSGRYGWNSAEPAPKVWPDVTAPATSAARQWQGWGTALKPASEHWILVRRPISEKTVAANVLRWGTGALNIDACRVLSDGKRPANNVLCFSCANAANQASNASQAMLQTTVANAATGKRESEESTTHSDSSTNAAMCASSIGTTTKVNTDTSSNTAMSGNRQTDLFQPDTLSTTRTKTSPTTALAICASCSGPITPANIVSNTQASLSGMPSTPVVSASLGRFPSNLILDEEAAAMLDEQSGTLKSGARNGKRNDHSEFGTFKERTRDSGKTFDSSDGGASRFFYVAKASKSDRGDDNKHPTVKSTKLMSYLIHLVTPPGGTVLDPFMGSGSTGVAAKAEGMRFVGIEQSAEYIEIAKKRLGA